MKKKIKKKKKNMDKKKATHWWKYLQYIYLKKGYVSNYIYKALLQFSKNNNLILKGKRKKKGKGVEQRPPKYGLFI